MIPTKCGKSILDSSCMLKGITAPLGNSLKWELKGKSPKEEERIYLYQTFNEVNSKYLFMYNATIKRYDVQLQRHESVSKCGDAKVGWGLDIIMALIQSDNWNWWQVTGAQSHLLHIFVADNLHNLAENQGIWYRNTTAQCKMVNFVRKTDMYKTKN